MRHDNPEEPARREKTRVPPLCLHGPLKIGMLHPPHEKRTPEKYTKKLAAFRTLANCHGAAYMRLKNVEILAFYPLSFVKPRVLRFFKTLHRDLHHAHADTNMSKRHLRRYRRFFFGISLPQNKGGGVGWGRAAAAAAKICSYHSSSSSARQGKRDKYR